MGLGAFGEACIKHHLPLPTNTNKQWLTSALPLSAFATACSCSNFLCSPSRKQGGSTLPAACLQAKEKTLSKKLLQFCLIFSFLKDLIMNYTFLHSMKYLTRALHSSWTSQAEKRAQAPGQAAVRAHTELPALLTVLPLLSAQINQSQASEGFRWSALLCMPFA